MSATAAIRAQLDLGRRRIMRIWVTCSRSRYFLLLGVLVALGATSTILTGHWSAFERKTFDLFMQARLRPPATNSEIVLINIDERSLAEMAVDYGRWPWPRRILGELIGHIEAQSPRAILLDVIIADPDVQNPDSEAAFDAAVRAAPHTYYSSIRLPERFDGDSALTVDRVPGVIPPTAPAAVVRPVAMLLPYLDSMLESGRVGTTNLLSDRDGVAREAYLFHDVGGWHIPSLAGIVATGLGSNLPAGDRIVLNWRGPPGVYPNLSFSDVYMDTLRQIRSRPADEFRGKIVLIGSTAAGLFDLRPTPVSTVYPGTEILATALDNIIQNDHVRRPPPWLAALLTAAFVMGLAWVFAFQYHDRIADSSFLLLQVFVGAAAFGVLHLAPVYIDASAPITFGTVYFGLARLSLASRDRSAAALLRERVSRGPFAVHVLWLRAESPSAKTLAQLQRLLLSSVERSCTTVTRLLPPTDSLQMLTGAFGGELGLVWFAADTGDEDHLVRGEIDQTIDRLEAWAAARAIALQHRVYSDIIPSATAAEHSSRLRHVLERVFGMPAPTTPEISHEK